MIKVPNFLSLDQCMDLTTSIDKDVWSQQTWVINKNNWQNNLTAAYDGAVYITNFKQHFPELDKKICWDITNGNYFKREIDWENTVFNIQVWDYLSGCNWHADNHCDFAITIYLNSVWEKEWGGNMEYYEGKHIETIVPEPGLMVINTDKQFHRVTKRTKPVPTFRYSLQCFGHFKK